VVSFTFKKGFDIMTQSEILIQTKLTALNKIRKIYHPLYKPKYTYSSIYDEYEGSYKEQRDSEINQIIDNLESELKKLKSKK
jgi:hypothetical protein